MNFIELQITEDEEVPILALLLYMGNLVEELFKQRLRLIEKLKMTFTRQRNYGGISSTGILMKRFKLV